MEHIVVYKAADLHSSFPHVIRLQNDDLVTSFRQAPFRDNMHYRHWDPQSRIALARSTDDGRTWDPASYVLIYSSDSTIDINMPMISQVSSGEVIVNGHLSFVSPSQERLTELGNLRENYQRLPGERYLFDSAILIRSTDNGRTWGEREPFKVGSLAYRVHTGKTGIVEMPDGVWLLPFHGRCRTDERTRIYIARSRDGGRTWGEPSTIAYDPDQRIGFHEPPLLPLPDGKLLTVTRTDGADGYLYQAFSEDGGWTWQGLKRTPIWGHPCHLLRLSSGRILCAYGYRREPFGIRAALSDDDGDTWDMDHELVIRDDGLHRDLGYPSSIQLKDGSILTTYYFHGEDEIRYVAGSIYSEDEILGR